MKWAKAPILCARLELIGRASGRRGSVDDFVIPVGVRVEEGSTALLVGQLRVNAKEGADRIIAPHLLRRTNVKRLRKLLAKFAVGAACEEAHGYRLSAHLGQLDRLCREFGSAIVAVLAIIADAEQYFSTDSTMARPTFSGASGLGVGPP